MRGSAHHREGEADSLLVPPQESMWTQQGPCGQQGNNCWVTKKVRKSVLSQEPEMQTCGSKFGKNCMNW